MAAMELQIQYVTTKDRVSIAECRGFESLLAPQLPDVTRAGVGMRRDIEFPSKELKCRGWLYVPDVSVAKQPAPAIVMAHGFSVRWPARACYARG
jgi:hypothetical protein